MRKQIGNKTVLSGAWRSALFPERPERRTRRPSESASVSVRSSARSVRRKAALFEPGSDALAAVDIEQLHAAQQLAACGADAVGQGGDRYGLVADDGDVAGDGRVLWQRRIGLLRQLQGQQGREVQLCGENLAVNAVAAGHERMDLAEAAEVDAAHADAGAAAGMERRVVLLGGIAGLGDIHARAGRPRSRPSS